AKTLGADEIRAIHFQLDQIQATNLEREWKTRGAGGFDLEIIECPDRRLRRGAMELVLEALADRETEVTVLLPRRIYPSVLARVLHDQTADTIANVVGQLPHATATIVPFVVPRSRRDRVLFVPRKRESRESSEEHSSHASDEHAQPDEMVPGAQMIESVHYRQRAKVVGRVARIRVGSSDAVPYLTVRLEDPTGGILLVFSGRKSVPGIATGRKMIAEGMVGEVGGHLAILNPGYEFLTSVEADD
ncbi:MAG: DNA-binding protein, partial [Acidimicrobiales bacterium]